MVWEEREGDVGGEGRWCGRRGKEVWEAYCSPYLQMTHHICSLISFPCWSISLILISTPVVK